MVQRLVAADLSPVLPREKAMAAVAGPISNGRAGVSVGRDGAATAASTPAASGAAHGPPVMGAVATLATKPSLVVQKHMRFLIMDQPKPGNLHLYLRECKRHNVVAICRVCEPTYSEDEVRAAGIALYELEYDDGGAPPPHIITTWLDLVKNTFGRAPSSSAGAGGTGADDPSRPCVALHCVAGLGRAPVLVAIALIEYGLDPVEAVDFIRKCRRGAINQRQLSYLQQYQRRRKPSCSTCSLM